MILRNEMTFDPDGDFFCGPRFVCNTFSLCNDGVREHFAIGRKKKFTFCVSDRRPPGDDWYLLLCRSYGYEVGDTHSEACLPSSFYRWADENFNSIKLYCWIEL